MSAALRRRPEPSRGLEVESQKRDAGRKRIASAARASWSTASGGRAGGGGAGVVGVGGIIAGGAGGAHAMPPTPAGGAGAARARVPPRRRGCRGAFCGASHASPTCFVLGRRCDRRRFGGPWSSRGGDGRDTESRRSTSDGVSILTIEAGQARSEARPVLLVNKSQWSLVKAESSAAPGSVSTITRRRRCFGESP